jgi:hypothetical protein
MFNEHTFMVPVFHIVTDLPHSRPADIRFITSDMPDKISNKAHINGTVATHI